MTSRPDRRHVVRAGDAPTPFTAEEIRAGCPPGRTVDLLVDVPGESPYVRRTRFEECGPEGSVQEVSRLTPGGAVLTPIERVRTTWKGLQSHASFRSDQTTVEPDLIRTALGALDCLRYTITDDQTTDTFWFARDRPGMPVRSTEHVRGRLVKTTVMIRDHRE